MKREEKLLCAIGGVDDDLIADAMELRKRKQPTWLRWTAVAACICMMLTATVGASKWSVEWWNGQKEAYGLFGDEEQGYAGESMQTTTVEWKYPFEPVTIRQEALDEMTGQLNQQWVYWKTFSPESLEDMADFHFLADFSHIVGNCFYEIEERFTTIGELEEYLGINLVTSHLIDGAAYNCMYTNDIDRWLEIGLYGDLCRDAEVEYAESGQIALHGIQITVRMGYSKTNCKSWMEIYIPLTQKFADTYPAEVVYDTLNYEPYTAETVQRSGRDVIVVCNPDEKLEENPKAYGVYSTDGIGYCIHCLAEDWENDARYPSVYQHGAERLMELLEDLE